MLHKQSMLLNIESTQIFFMDELIDSLLEPKAYKQKAEEGNENDKDK